MQKPDDLAARFDRERPHMRAVAYRMLSSTVDAEDAVQEAWLRLNRADAGAIEDLRAWLTTVVARISLNMLRSRQTRREEPLDVRVPDPVVEQTDRTDPEQAAVVADSVGLALLVVLDTLSPTERLAFVLHDVFAVPFDEIAPMIDRSPAAARQLASRARRRVQGAPVPDAGVAAQRRVVDAFFAAATAGDFEALVAVLHPDVVLRADFGRAGPSGTVHGASVVAGRALMFSNVGREARPATVNGAAGVVVYADGRPFSVMGFTVVGGKIASIEVLADRERLDRLQL